MADMVYGEEEKGGEEGEEEEEGESDEGEEEGGESESGEGESDEGEKEGDGEGEEGAEEEGEEDKEKEPVDSDVCFHCHQPGHKARKCPLLHPELKKEPRMKEKKNITELQIRDRVNAL